MSWRAFRSRFQRTPTFSAGQHFAQFENWASTQMRFDLGGAAPSLSRVVHNNVLLAAMLAIKTPNVLRQSPLPRYWHRDKKRVETSVVKSLA